MPLPDALDDSFDFSVRDPQFLTLAFELLGNSAESTDGFDNLFTPTALGFPGPDIGSQILNPTIDSTETAHAESGIPSDPAFDDDHTQAVADAGGNIDWLDSHIHFDPNPRPIVPPNYEDDLPTQPNGTLITLQDGTQIYELPANWIHAADDGTITWQAGESAPEPIELFLSVDGQEKVLFHGDRTGSDRPDWITAGHIFYFELHASGFPIAATTLDTHDSNITPQDENSEATPIEIKVLLPDGTVKVSTVVIQPAAPLTIDPAGTQAHTPAVTTPPPKALSVVSTSTTSTPSGDIVVNTVENEGQTGTIDILVSGPAFLPITGGNLKAPVGYSVVYQNGQPVGYQRGDQVDDSGPAAFRAFDLHHNVVVITQDTFDANPGFYTKIE